MPEDCQIESGYARIQTKSCPFRNVIRAHSHPRSDSNSWFTCLQAFWPGWDSLRDRPSGSLASYRKLSVLRHHSWSTRPPVPWSLPAWSSSSWEPSSSLPSASVSQLAAGSKERKGNVTKQLFFKTENLRKRWSEDHLKGDIKLFRWRLLPLAGHPGNRCSWVLHTYRLFSHCQDTPGCSWNSAPHLKDMLY